MEPKSSNLLDIESGLGIGGAGSDDYNIHISIPNPPEIHPDYNDGGGFGKCELCGKPNCHWNCGAGGYYCERHWDSY
jgi:hypothetical protein